jgi:NAD+ diphosphatase
MPLGALPLSRGSLDRAAHRRAEPDLIPKLLADPATRVAVLVAESMEVLPDGALVVRPPAPDDRHRLAFFLGEENTGEGGPDSETERVAYLAVVGDPTDAGHGDWQTLRNVGASLTDRDAGIFTTTQALANWHAAHQFCPRCGEPTEPEQAGWIRRCTRDGSEHYPRTDPAVIMAVVDDDDRLLLGRNAQWPEGRFSVLAGFVEPGESFEAAVAREVEEEVGIAVTDVTYLGNQPWPFPSSEMVGFRARATTTVLIPDRAEMAEARWFTREEYRNALRNNEIRTPSGISIAQRLIEHWLGHRIADIEDVSW